MAKTRINKELRIIQDEANENISAGPSADNLFEWDAMIIGPTKTPYEGGMFRHMGYYRMRARDEDYQRLLDWLDSLKSVCMSNVNHR
jgi:hypothetical protein